MKGVKVQTMSVIKINNFDGIASKSKNLKNGQRM